jgi:hypothetical protein
MRSLLSRTLVSIIADPQQAGTDEVIKGLVEGLEELRCHLPRAYRERDPAWCLNSYDQLLVGDLFTELEPGPLGVGGALR